MANWSADEVANAALESLNIKPRGGSARAEDKAKMDEIYTSVYSDLRHEGKIDFTVGAVPDRYQQFLKMYLVGLAASEFHFSGQRLLEKQQEGKYGYDKLCALSADLSDYSTGVDHF